MNNRSLGMQPLIQQRLAKTGRVILAWWLVMLVVTQLPQAKAAERGDGAALNAIFGEPVLSQNATQIVVTSRSLPLEPRYEYLSRWVLPNQGHGFRIDGVIQRLPEHDVDTADPSVLRIADYPETHWIVCPARELVQLASELGRLDDLREQALQQTRTENGQDLAQATLLTLIDIALGQRDRVAEDFAKRFTGARSDLDANAARQWWSDLVVLWAAMENPHTADLVIEDYFGLFTLGTYKSDRCLDVIADYLCLLYRVRSNDSPRVTPQQTQAAAMFDAFSRVDAYTHARSSPLPRFHFNDRGVVKLSGHENDYLSLRSPLTGDFEVSGEVATYSGAFSELVVAGVAVSPVPDLPQVSIGGFAKGYRRQAITPPLQPIGTSSRFRVQADTTKATHFLSSREAYTDSDNEPSAPWIALRSWRRTHSAISELSIDGSPTIPNHIDLVSGKELRGWASYFDAEDGAGPGPWSSIVDSNSQWTLSSESTGEVAGCNDENLLYYVRPLTWNAVITYEFEYQGESCAVHPCLGRWVFLIKPDGVWLHQLTDGRHEATGLRPDNAIRMGSSTEPTGLKQGWNRAELRIEEDRVSLWLNEKRIGDRAIKPGESRTFGFFHYRDQSRANVRAVRLTGDWPRELPALEEQALAAHKVAMLDAASEKLAASWSHDFRQGIPPRFFFTDGDPSLATQLSDGIRVHRLNSAPALHLNFEGLIQGDFDITLEFKELRLSHEKPTWHTGVGLAVTFDNAERDRLDVVRRIDRLNRHHHIVFGRNRVNQFGGVDWVKDTTYIDESTAGRLRIVRKGDVIYGLYADGDSKTFRYLDEVTIQPGALVPHGLRLHTVTGNDLPIAVTWVRLDVRAEAISIPTFPAPQVIRVIPGREPTPPVKSLPGRFYDSIRGLFD
jgi:hypothetical protein